ncbi:MAG: response regulator transcription factor [Bacteroidia bacterium]|nr:response regulator transcription factor [Bacteroidia bacterium]
MRKKIILVDDHELFTEGLVQMIEEETDLEVVATYTNGLQALEQVPKHPDLDLLLMDLDMPIMDGMKASKELRAKMPELPIVILSMHHEKVIVQKLVQQGVNGYILKSSSKKEFLQGIYAVLKGIRFYSSRLTEGLIQEEKVLPNAQSSLKSLAMLTEREVEVLKLLAEGNTSKEIADVLALSPQTVDGYRKALIKKLNSKNVAGLIRIAFREGLIS